MLKPESATILSIFNAPHKIVVPKYQRNFTWGRDEAQELIEDVKTKLNDPSFNLFLGSVIFDISKSKDGYIYVIDGQQRLTTASILLIACRQIAKKKNNKLAGAIQEKISFKDPYSGDYEGQRLIVSPSIKELYEYISKDNWPGDFTKKIANRSIRKQVNKIRPLYEFFIDEIKNYTPKELEKFVRSLYDAYFIRIDIENTSQAFDIFERMNARGVPLDVADLLKNHLFANVDTTDIEEKWVEIVENSGNTTLRMLKYFWVSKTGHVKKSDLYKKIREYSINKGHTKLVGELEDFSYFYWMIREGEIADVKEFLEDKKLTEISSNQAYLERFFGSIEALRFFRITQVYPVLYSALNCFLRDRKRSAKDLLDLLDVFEKYHFINNVICERVGNEVEKLYTEYASDFNKEKFLSLSKNLRQNLKNRLATKEEFISNFTTLTYGSDSISLICYIYDRINNNTDNTKGAQRVKIFYPDPSIQKKNYNVEHFLSRKEKNSLNLEKETIEAIDNIGNLLVISRHTNSGLGSLSPQTKMEALKSNKIYTNNLPYLHKFIVEYEKDSAKWNKETIGRRAERTAQLAYQKIWMF